MSRFLFAAALAAAAVAAIPAGAHESRAPTAVACSPANAEAVQAMATRIRGALEGLGYRVETLRRDDGCLVGQVVNDSGLPVLVRYDAATGDLLRARLRH